MKQKRRKKGEINRKGIQTERKQNIRRKAKKGGVY